jgi:hypothetical protein
MRVQLIRTTTDDLASVLRFFSRFGGSPSKPSATRKKPIFYNALPG